MRRGELLEPLGRLIAERGINQSPVRADEQSRICATLSSGFEGGVRVEDLVVGGPARDAPRQNGAERAPRIAAARS